MATLYEAAVFSERVYGGPNAPEVPPGWRSLGTSEDYYNQLDGWEQEDWSRDFYAETYVNDNTGEMVTAMRGTNGPGDVFPEWIQIFTGTSTGQDESATNYLGAMNNEADAAGYQLSCVGHSAGDTQCQAATVKNNDLDTPDITGIGFNGSGSTFGEGETGQDYTYVNVDTRGDLVNRVGPPDLGDTEIVLPTGPGAVEYISEAALGGLLFGIPGAAAATVGNIKDAHDMRGVREYLERYPHIGNLTVEKADSLESHQVELIRESPDLFRYYDDEAETTSTQDNDAQTSSTDYLPTAEEAQNADNPESVGEDVYIDNDTEHTSPLPTAEDVQNADNPDDVGEESMNPWGATDNDAENAGDPANVTPESDADLEQRYLQQLNAGTKAIREGAALVEAIEEGDDLSIIENALDLTGSLNTLSSNLTGDGRTLLSGNVTAGMNALAAGAGLLGAIEGGDDWAITSSSVNLLKGVDDFLENMGHDLIADKIDIGLDGKGMDLFGGAAMTGAALAYDMAMETYCVEIEI